MSRKNGEFSECLDDALNPILSSIGNILLRLSDWTECEIDIRVKRCIGAFDDLSSVLRRAIVDEYYSSQSLQTVIEFLDTVSKDPSLRFADKKTLGKEDHKQLHVATMKSLRSLHYFGDKVRKHYSAIDMNTVSEEVSWSIICIKMLRLVLKNHCFRYLNIDGSVIYDQKIKESDNG